MKKSMRKTTSKSTKKAPTRKSVKSVSTLAWLRSFLPSFSVTPKAMRAFIFAVLAALASVGATGMAYFAFGPSLGMFSTPPTFSKMAEDASASKTPAVSFELYTHDFAKQTELIGLAARVVANHAELVSRLDAIETKLKAAPASPALANDALGKTHGPAR